MGVVLLVLHEHITNSTAMEDIRLAASLFFEKEPQLKQIARTEFSTLAQTTPGRVPKKAFDQHLWQRQPECSSRNLGAELDSNGDGYLTFEDFLVYRYLFQTRPVCGQCKAIIKLVFYTCLQCFADKSKGPTYDLCPKCYLGKKFSHPHSNFHDNYAMVNAVRKPPMAAPALIRMGMSIEAHFGGELTGDRLVHSFIPGSGD